MKHLLALLFLLLLLPSCQTVSESQKPIYHSGLTYPATSIALGSSLQLRHLAGAPCEHDSNDRPAVGSDGERTHSTYEIISSSGTILVSAPSMLSDPKYSEAEFQEYYRKNDEISVHVSPSGRTILIVEDRSPTYPRRAHILLRRNAEGTWSWADLEIPARACESRSITAGNVYPEYLEVASISDSHVHFHANNPSRMSYAELTKNVTR